MIARPGDVGEAVALLQRRLARAGYPVVESSIYDRVTENAVKALQAAKGLVVDGIAGPKTFTALAGVVPGHYLTDADLVKAAQALGLPVAIVRTVNEVESKGHGMLPEAEGKAVILFERHVFWKRLEALPEHVPFKQDDGLALGLGQHPVALRLHLVDGADDRHRQAQGLRGLHQVGVGEVVARDHAGQRGEGLRAGDAVHHQALGGLQGLDCIFRDAIVNAGLDYRVAGARQAALQQGDGFAHITRSCDHGHSLRRRPATLPRRAMINTARMTARATSKKSRWWTWNSTLMAEPARTTRSAQANQDTWWRCRAPSRRYASNDRAAAA